ncbi:hemerythrin domain-containing protein [bacterium]|nr:hemerythrin domain-containing protein [bacterium]
MVNPSSPTVQSEPIQDFSHCHEGILKKLDMLGELPALLAPAARARDIAGKAVEFFREAIFEHHLDEERELFPAVLSSANEGEELAHVKTLVKRLTDEHRELEGMWKRLESPLKKVAKGQLGDISVAEIQRLVSQYRAHAEFEEQEFLPLSQTILGRNSHHLAALGLSLHMRHAPAHVNATYI